MDLHTVGCDVISHGGDGRFVVLVVDAGFKEEGGFKRRNDADETFE